MHYPTMIALMVGATLSGNVLADHHSDHQHRQHEAHVHGQVELNIAQDGHDLLLEITAPGADVVVLNTPLKMTRKSKRSKKP